MTESTLYEIQEKEFSHSKSNDNMLLEKCVQRPSGIPRLVTATATHNHNLDSISNENHIKPVPTVSPKSQYREALISPTYTKRISQDAFSFAPPMNTESNKKAVLQSQNRQDRALSEERHGRKSAESSYSEHTNNSGSTGPSNIVITSKIGSFANARHKPGGGNIKIIERKVDFSNVEARCGSKKNIKYQPGGGDVEIVNRRLEFSKTAEPKVNSLKNLKYQPQGGDVKIDNRKLEWSANSKVGSMNNVKYKPGGGNVQIVNEQLPWLKYNKPNLPSEEIAKIQKRSHKDRSNESMSSPPLSYSNSQCSDHSR